MKKIIQNVIFLLVVLFCNKSYAQNNFEDVIYLKNGSIIRGIIIEQVPNKSFKIQTADRNVFFYKNDEIEKITKENLPVKNSFVKNFNKITDFKKSGFINLTEVNKYFGIGKVEIGPYSIGDNLQRPYGFKTVNGYQFNEHLSLGIGLGIDKYTSNNFQVPITLDLRATFLKGKISPVFIANIGYSFGLYKYKSGLVINPQIGIKTYISKNVAYLFNVGCNLWNLQYVGNPYITQNNVTTAYFQFVTFSTGFSF